ncbi:sigma-70 family RNA polymerase sigma factor [Mucilaginibacter sp. RS28]|uniref:Sigma-70 family RNA polymerase sigma factor n=1 Tax=Mucilaginibacter straminoryzae TaxID=2932774 RepID=A0A9X1X545_9SPHI|nr:sigma-70 family RNA polymerase sigma factor [Mucilaginibacter straminoryzae]
MNGWADKISRGSDLTSDWHAFIYQSSEPAFKRIYTHYFHYFSFIGNKKGFDAALTQDTINELFLYVWENQERLPHVKNHHNYLVTSFLRRLYKDDSIETEDVAGLTDLPDSLVVPSAETIHIYNNINSRHSEALLKVVNNLPERQRLMIYQKFYLGLSYNEIAESNNVSINTVYNTIYKAISNLRNAINDEDILIFSLASAFVLFFLFFFR